MGVTSNIFGKINGSAGGENNSFHPDIVVIKLFSSFVWGGCFAKVKII